MAAKTGQGNTPARSLRVPEDVWRAAMSRAERDGVSLSSVIVGFLREYGSEN